MMKLTDATVRLRNISVNTVHKRCSVAVVAVDNCPFSLALPDGRKGEDTKKECAFAHSLMLYMGVVYQKRKPRVHITWLRLFSISVGLRSMSSKA